MVILHWSSLELGRLPWHTRMHMHADTHTRKDRKNPWNCKQKMNLPWFLNYPVQRARDLFCSDPEITVRSSPTHTDFRQRKVTKIKHAAYSLYHHGLRTATSSRSGSSAAHAWLCALPSQLPLHHGSVYGHRDPCPLPPRDELSCQLLPNLQLMIWRQKAPLAHPITNYSSNQW